MHQTPVRDKSRPAAGPAILFQPFVSVQERRVVGMEGALPCPGDASTPATAAGVLEAFQRGTGRGSQLLLTLNLPAAWLASQPQSPVHLGRLLEQTGLRPSRLVLLLEGVAPEALPSLPNPVQKLKRLGCLLALAGPPSGELPPLGALALLEPDLVVLDQRPGPVKIPGHVSRELVGLAHRLGSLVLVRGVEDQNTALNALYAGADYLQGEFFAPPLPRPGEPETLCAPGLEAAFSCLGLGLVEHLAHERRRRRRYRRVMEHLLDQLSWVSPPEFERVLDELAGLDAELSCLYVLDRRGRQCTGLVFNPSLSPAPRREALCPLARGADCSLRPFYLEARIGEGIHLSPPRPSLATGRLCLLAAARFRDRRGETHVLCAEFELSR